MFGGFPLDYPMVNYDEQPTKYRSAPIEKQRTVSEGMQSQQNIGAKRSGKYKSYDGAYQTSSDSGSIDIRSYADSLQEELMKKIQENDCLKREVTALKSSMQGLEQRGSKQQEHGTQRIPWKGKSTGRSRPLNDGERKLKNEDCNTDDSNSANDSGAGMIEDRFTGNDPVTYQELNNSYNYPATNSIGSTKADEYQRLKKLAEQSDHMIEIGWNFEDVNDESSCSNITKECTRLNKDWANLSRNIIKSSIPELDAIHALSELMKFCYYKCRTTADRQIRQFWLLNDTENVPQHPHLPRILHLRKCTSKEDWVREKIKKDVFTELCQAHADTFERIYTKGLADKVKDSMEQFFHKYIDCCWLMAISYPPIVFNFEVVGKLYVELLSEGWSEYSMNDPVEDMEKPSGTIVEVAWPCVERQDGSGFYAKGEVVILRRVDNKSDE